MAYELTKDLETGNTLIDDEHRKLFKAVNSVLDACNKGQGNNVIEPAIKFLLGYVDIHFAHEEKLQKDSNYPGFASHRAFHKKFKKELLSIAAQIPSDTTYVADLIKLNGHISVLIGHIRTEDKKLGLFLKEQ